MNLSSAWTLIDAAALALEEGRIHDAIEAWLVAGDVYEEQGKHECAHSCRTEAWWYGRQLAAGVVS
jgi:uncharacterized protein HemY